MMRVNAMVAERNTPHDAQACVGRLSRPRRGTLLGRMAALGLTLALALWGGLATANELKVGAAAPSLVLHTLDGQNIATRDLRGEVVLVTFWATWCAPCRAELPVLSAYAERHAAQGLRVLAFSLDDADNLAAVRKAAANFRFPVGLLGSPWAGGYGRVWRLPVTFVIDRQGNLVYDGWNDADPVWTAEKLHQIVDPLLGKPG